MPENSSGEAVMKHAFIASIAATAALLATSAVAQTAREVLGPAAVVPLTEQQPPARIIVDPPLAEPLSHGRVFIQYRAENLRIVPVFGPNALAVSPRIGHIHVSVDDAPWHWADASGEPLILVDLPPGPHKVQIILANANHQPLDQATVEFMVPERDAARP
jgi:Family of unknown function (DUF6130)